MALYKIVRYFQNGRKRTMRHDMYLEEAKAHCSDPETSSKTAVSAYAKRLTSKYGPWFDGYTEDRRS